MGFLFDAYGSDTLFGCQTGPAGPGRAGGHAYFLRALALVFPPAVCNWT